MKLHHVGIVVRELAEAVERLRQLGLEEADRRVVEEWGVVVSLLPAGGAELECIQPLSEGPVARFLERRGEGLHHVAFAVEDLEGALAELVERGVRLVDERPRPGFRGSRVAFLHPESFCGVLVELVEEESGRT